MSLFMEFTDMTRKIGFWPVFALVTGSQIGSGVFMLPASLAPYGHLSLLGWFLSGLGAVLLALVFAQLCSRIPKTGGPHAYAHSAFGPTAAFFTGWTYWVISWVSTTAVVIASVGYLTPLIGIHSPITRFILQVCLLAIVTLINVRGVKTAGTVEFFLTNLKLIPLILMPLAALFYFKSSNITYAADIQSIPLTQNIGHVVLLTLWGFIGVESATTSAGSVQNPSKTIPKAVVFGTLTVALLYAFNSIGIMGVIPSEQLANSQAPYADSASIVFGGNWHLLISLLASIICIGTLNAWMLTSGQIALGLAQDGFMPSGFKKLNRYGAPYYSVLISGIGIVPLLMLTLSDNLAQQITTIIDISVTAFLFVYLISVLSCIKIMLKQEEPIKIVQWFYMLGAFVFCGWIISTVPLMVLGIASLFVVSGIPVYFWQKRARFISLKNHDTIQTK